MKGLLLVSAICLFFVDAAHSQMRVIYPESVKSISAPLPSFPPEVKDLIYGEEVRVLNRY